MNATRGHEDGQVTPALLMAVIGAFALAVIFVVIARGEDQGGRSDTAADAAALAIGREYQRHTGTFLAPMIETKLPVLAAYQPITAAAAAQQYADANGARVVAARYEGFDPLTLEWRYWVKVEQQDTIEGGGRSHEPTTSTATVAVKAVGGLCTSAEGAAGFISDEQCVGPTQMLAICLAEKTGQPSVPHCPTVPEVLNAFEAEIRLVS